MVNRVAKLADPWGKRSLSNQVSSLHIHGKQRYKVNTLVKKEDLWEKGGEKMVSLNFLTDISKKLIFVDKKNCVCKLK